MMLTRSEREQAVKLADERCAWLLRRVDARGGTALDIPAALDNVTADLARRLAHLLGLAPCADCGQYDEAEPLVRVHAETGEWLEVCERCYERDDTPDDNPVEDDDFAWRVRRSLRRMGR